MPASFRTLVLGLAVLLASASAQADIKSFNTAMKAGDFKTAAAEAASTWPALDKTREDLPIIAREFGFAAYMAGDFAAAAMFATEALREAGDTPEVAASRTQSAVLLRAAEHRTKPTDATRNALVAALRGRAALQGLDAITFLAARDALNYDVGKGRWSAALESSALAKTLAESGGPEYRVSALRFEMWQAAALHATSKDSGANDRLEVLRKQVIAEIDAAASDAEARMLVSLFWEVGAWDAATEPPMTRFNRNNSPADDGLAEKDPSLRSTRLLESNPNPACKFKPDFKQSPAIPEYASDNKFNGVVVMKVDIDENGVMSNATSLASAPDPALGPGLVEFLVKTRNNRFRQDGEWAPSCTLARKGYIFTWIFQPAR